MLLHSVDPRGFVTLTLNRPELHNALDDTLIRVLTEAFRNYDADPAIRGVILRGAGKSFSAGADLNWMRRMADYTEAENIADARNLAGLLRVFDRLTKPTIAVVHGNCFGGGMGLVSCADIAIAAESAVFCLPEV
ncbi:MAG: enoyl-CoA hydratase-related protein, partial [Dongiaceae bacterium]